MATNSRNKEVRFAAESSFCENINSVGSNAYGTRIPVQSASFTPTQPRIADNAAQSRNNVYRPGLKGTRSAGTFEFTVYACGHLTAPTGALTETWLYTLLSKGLGGGNSADSGTTVASATDANTWVSTANPADFLPGSVLRVGASGDARGNGQAAVVDTIATSTTINTLQNLDATPNASDVLYATLQAYPTDGFTDLGGSTRTVRFIYAHPDTGLQYHLLGCQLAGLSVGVSVGGIPTITLRYAVAFWDRAANTDVVAMADDLAAPVAGADLFFQTVGTATRATLSAQSISIGVELGLIPHETVGGDHPLQTITGWTRTMCTVDVSIRLHEWASTYETLWDLDGSSATHKHALFQSTTTAGRVFGFYLPDLFASGARPAPEDVNGLTGVSFSMKATEGPDTTSALSRSIIRFFMG